MQGGRWQQESRVRPVGHQPGGGLMDEHVRRDGHVVGASLLGHTKKPKETPTFCKNNSQLFMPSHNASVKC